MARDVRTLRAEAAEATSAGKHKKALVAYLELERLEPRDAQWSKRAAESYRRIGKDRDAIEAFARAADRYAQSGFLVQALAVCKLILQIDPKNDEALQRIASMNEQISTGPTRAAAIAESNPSLAENAAVAALRSGATGSLSAISDRRGKPTSIPPISIPRTRTPPNLAIPRTKTPQQVSVPSIPPADQAPARATPMPEAVRERAAHPSAPPELAVSRTKSKPVTMPPDQGLDAISLKDQVPNAFEREENSGVYVIPIDDPLDDLPSGLENQLSSPLIEIEPPDEVIADGSGAYTDDDELLEDATELDLEDLEEIPLPEPRLVAAAAAEALAATPLFAGLSSEALESLVQRLQLVHLGCDEVLFHEGDPGDALYVIVEGEVSVQAEGPPRVEMARLGAGSFIGEVALMTDQPRSATVTATSDAELLRIDRKTLSQVLATHGEVLSAVLRFVRDRLVDRWTRTSPLFRPFDPSERSQLASRFRFLEIEAGTTLLNAGAKPDGLYIVLAGNFAVMRGDQQVASVGPGDLIGETALLSGSAFKSEVTARGKSLALCLPANEFRELIMTHPHVLEYVGEAAEHSRKLQIL
jgi:CRP-like cAMP-binding protein